MRKAYIFDLDDTLYEEQSYVREAFRHTAAYAAEKVGHAELADTLYERMMTLLIEEGRGRILDTVCKEYGLRIPARELVEVYRSTVPSLVLYPDAEETLRALRERGVKLGLVTDGLSRVQHAKADALMLPTRLDAIVATDDYETHKPEAAAYEACLALLGAQATDAVYIGDNPEKDFIGARALGMKTVRIRRPLGMCAHREGTPEQEADVDIKLLTELLTMEL